MVPKNGGGGGEGGRGGGEGGGEGGGGEGGGGGWGIRLSRQGLGIRAERGGNLEKL